MMDFDTVVKGGIIVGSTPTKQYTVFRRSKVD